MNPVGDESGRAFFDGNPRDSAWPSDDWTGKIERLDSSKQYASEFAWEDRVGCSQPAISQMLNRNCRPQKKTIFKLAEALNVHACDLWQDLEVAEMLDAVASFQQDEYVMTHAEASALSDTTKPNLPKIPVKSLPVRRR